MRRSTSLSPARTRHHRRCVFSDGINGSVRSAADEDAAVSSAYIASTWRFLRIMDTRSGPALLPVRKPLILCVDRFDLAALQRRTLCVLDRVFNRTLAIRIADTTDIGDSTVVRERHGVHGVQLRSYRSGRITPCLRAVSFFDGAMITIHDGS